MDYDTYLERQIDKHTRDNIYYSNCCGTEMDEDTDICPLCKEHCDILSQEDIDYDIKCEIGDQKHQQRKDEMRRVHDNNTED